MKPKIYVAGPYTKGDVILNVRHAVEVGDYIVSLGGVPYVPHITMLWHTISPHDIDFWYDYDLEWLKSCSALYRIEGESTGADREVDHARSLSIPVFIGEPQGMGQLRIWIRERGNR